MEYSVTLLHGTSQLKGFLNISQLHYSNIIYNLIMTVQFYSHDI
jgi:hypothetical protein